MPYALGGRWQPPPVPLQPHLLGEGARLVRTRQFLVRQELSRSLRVLLAPRNEWPRCAHTPVALYTSMLPTMCVLKVYVVVDCCRLPRAPWRAEPLCGRPSRSSQAPGTEAPDRSPSTSRNLRLECLVAPRPYMSRPRSSCLSPSRAQRVNFHSAPAQVSHLHLLHAPQIPACVFLLLIASPDSLRTKGAPGLHGPRAQRPRRLGLGSGAPWCSFRCSFGFYQ